MAIPHVYSPIQPQDFTLNTIVTHKRVIVNASTIGYIGTAPNANYSTSSGYVIQDAHYNGEKLKIGVRTYPTNSADGSNKHVVWNFIDARYYRNPYDRFATFEHANRQWTYKMLSISASVVSIPYLEYGESIKPGSIRVTNSDYGYDIWDDGNGNLYERNIYSTGSLSPTSNLVAYWGFNNEFRRIKGDNTAVVESSIFDFDSRTFQQYGSYGKGVVVAPGFWSGLDPGYGHCLYFNNDRTDSYLLTAHHPDFNFDYSGDFSINFLIYGSDQFAGNRTIISKRGTARRITTGNSRTTIGDKIHITNYHSSSFVNVLTPVYPYDFSYDSAGRVVFRRSDGKSILALSSSTVVASSDAWHSIGIVKSGSLYSMYYNGTVDKSASANISCGNDYALIFGALNTAESQSTSVALDEIRFYNTGLRPDQMYDLGNIASPPLVFQTTIIGNAFYRSGILVFDGNRYGMPAISKDSTEWTLEYRSTHTIFQYELLARIKKGSHNLSQNRTALINPESDLLIDDMVTGSLYPYATSIGFYNDKGEMMAIAKLNQPLQMRDDVDINILARIDV